MKAIHFLTTLLFTMVLLNTGTFAQKVYKVKYESQADKKIYFVDYESQADLKIFIVD